MRNFVAAIASTVKFKYGISSIATATTFRTNILYKNEQMQPVGFSCTGHIKSVPSGLEAEGEEDVGGIDLFCVCVCGGGEKDAPPPPHTLGDREGVIYL